MSGVKRLRDDHPAAARAITELNERVGFDVRVVLSPGSWQVARLPDGTVQVLINAEGMRALASFAPRPDAGEQAERLIRLFRGES